MRSRMTVYYLKMQAEIIVSEHQSNSFMTGQEDVHNLHMGGRGRENAQPRSLLVPG